MSHEGFPCKDPAMYGSVQHVVPGTLTFDCASTMHSKFKLICYGDNLSDNSTHSLGIYNHNENRFWYHVRASINMTWVCIQGFGLGYCTQMSVWKKNLACCSLWRETFGYPHVADDGGCDLLQLLKKLVGFVENASPTKTFTERQTFHVKFEYVYETWLKKEKHEPTLEKKIKKMILVYYNFSSFSHF